ncbi:MAG: 23S rRNA (pseudouridine(1915)-N(3))-methyltransferase RlmH [Pseudoflavonifractor sp.]|nr:23S rRNA (pseudouridine(1915)-N(3))-methyltransferase RlmH [Alloprevotella sp.]MCM1116355.1 23S rRNA (pseudouridine(1915)-N(3))-methyltransferase RlmH [Pseudoflavonifractor sp.]
MKISLLTVGRTTDSAIARAIEHYALRAKRYIDFEITSVADVKASRAMTEERQKELEGQSLLGALKPGDYVWLLDEHGHEYTSRELAAELQRKMAAGLTKRIVFIVGGPYGFSPEVKQRADAHLSLSRLTFPHELVRLFFTEQIYRAMTILRGEPYHHD